MEVKPTYNVNGEPAPRRGYFNRENAEAMDQVIQAINRQERVLVPSHMNPTGWKELDKDDYLHKRKSYEGVKLKPIIRTERSVE